MTAATSTASSCREFLTQLMLRFDLAYTRAYALSGEAAKARVRSEQKSPSPTSDEKPVAACPPK